MAPADPTAVPKTPAPAKKTKAQEARERACLRARDLDGGLWTVPPGSFLHQCLQKAVEQHELVILPVEVLRDPDSSWWWQSRSNQAAYELALGAAEEFERESDPARKRSAAARALNVGLFVGLRARLLEQGIQQPLVENPFGPVPATEEEFYEEFMNEQAEDRAHG